MSWLHVPRLGAATLLRRGALAYLILWVLAPPLAYGTGWRILALVAMSLWMLLDVRSPRSVVLRPSWPVLGSFAFVLYTAAVEWIASPHPDFNRHFQVWIMLFFLLVGESFRRGRDGDARFAFWWILWLLPVWVVATINALDTVSDDVARLLVRSSAEATELAEQGVGGFGLVYAVVLALPLLAQLVLAGRRRLAISGGRWRTRMGYALVLLNFLLCLLLVLRAGYSIAVLLAGWALACILVIRSRRALPFAVSVCFAALLVFAGSLALDPLLGSLQDSTVGTEYEAKIRDIRVSLHGGESAGTLEARTSRYQRSADVFVQNPILGSLTLEEVGGHSALLDRFAQYGLLVGALFLSLLVFVPWRILRDSRVPVGMGLAFLFVAVAYPTVNTVFMAWGLMLYVFSRGALVVMGVPPDHRVLQPAASRVRSAGMNRRF